MGMVGGWAVRARDHSGTRDDLAVVIAILMCEKSGTFAASAP